MRPAVIMSVQDELICVRLVMPRCMFSMQLSLQHVAAVCSMQLSCRSGQTRGNRVVREGSWTSGRCVRTFKCTNVQKCPQTGEYHVR